MLTRKKLAETRDKLPEQYRDLFVQVFGPVAEANENFLKLAETMRKLAWQELNARDYRIVWKDGRARRVARVQVHGKARGNVEMGTDGKRPPHDYGNVDGK